MDKVNLALETVGLTAEKTNLENEFREGASELKTVEVSLYLSLSLCLSLALTHSHLYSNEPSWIVHYSRP